MKTIILFTLLILSTINSYGQEPLSFEKVIQVENMDKASIFAVVHEWFASTYNSANDVIQMADKEAGTIVGKGIMDYSFGKKIYECYDGSIKYTIKVYVKDDRFKVELTNFNHSEGIGKSSACGLGLITTAEEYTNRGMSKKYQNAVWTDIKLKAEDYANRISKSIESKTQQTKTNDDW